MIRKVYWIMVIVGLLLFANVLLGYWPHWIIGLGLMVLGILGLKYDRGVYSG